MPRFTPRAIRSRHEEIDRIAVEVLDDLAASDDVGEFDFVERVAAPAADRGDLLDPRRAS